jgi:hypothetical protein
MSTPLTVEQAHRESNNRACRTLAGLIDGKVSLRHHVHFTTKKDTWYIVINGSAVSGYGEASEIDLILTGMLAVARAASGKAADESRQYWHDQYYANPHNPAKEVEPCSPMN